MGNFYWWSLSMEEVGRKAKQYFLGFLFAYLWTAFFFLAWGYVQILGYGPNRLTDWLWDFVLLGMMAMFMCGMESLLHFHSWFMRRFFPTIISE